ncbi:MAG: tRNA threonylcarbamoyladenosine dehydratase [Succinivibrio sp.]|nr:tRNA threonylcarbamoyladenosine dehydratase [Succinivibrio sp.]
MIDLKQAFRGIRALYGESGFDSLQRSHVMVVGLGGVGSWLAEALCRSAVGELSLIDFDNIELSNLNRQLHTTCESLGRVKVEELAQRFKLINPEIKLNLYNEKITQDNLRDILQTCPQYVAEAIDDLEVKPALIDYLYKAKKTFITLGGAGGRMDPGALSLGDLASAHGDALLSRVRSILRKEYHYPAGGVKMHIMCTYSCEKPVYSSKEGYQSGDLPAFGAAMPVTATAGLMAASWIISQIVKA